MQPLLLPAKNTAYLRVKNLKNKRTGEIITSANTAQVRLLNQHGQEVAGATWPISLTPGAEPGTFEANLPSTLSVTPGQMLTAEITIDAGSGLVFYSVPRVRVIERTD